MTALGLIPARGGSKGIAEKNIVPLAGRPLLAYTCVAALGSSTLTRVVCSTDSEPVAEVARACGVEVLERPAALAQDDTPMLDVLTHALAALRETETLVLLQPTSPLRRSEHIDAAVALLGDTGADSVVSVVKVPHAFVPESLLVLDEGALQPYLPGAAPRRRQDKPVLYARNGPAVLATRASTLNDGSLYGRDVRALVMSPAESIDVDDADDLQIAEALLGA
jgi:CMP-N-acetylneuraminic acid synthetase